MNSKILGFAVLLIILIGGGYYAKDYRADRQSGEKAENVGSSSDAVVGFCGLNMASPSFVSVPFTELGPSDLGISHDGSAVCGYSGGPIQVTVISKNKLSLLDKNSQDFWNSKFDAYERYQKTKDDKTIDTISLSIESSIHWQRKYNVEDDEVLGYTFESYQDFPGTMHYQSVKRMEDNSGETLVYITYTPDIFRSGYLNFFNGKYVSGREDSGAQWKQIYEEYRDFVLEDEVVRREIEELNTVLADSLFIN